MKGCGVSNGGRAGVREGEGKAKSALSVGGSGGVEGRWEWYLLLVNGLSHFAAYSMRN